MINENTQASHQIACDPEAAGIVGCRFSVFPMSDQYVDYILSAIEDTDTTKVWMETDEVSTCVRGRTSHVFDVVQAIFTRVASSGAHTALSATFSVGCPGDTAGHTALTEDDIRMNKVYNQQADLQTAAQFAIYPMGVQDYMSIIAREVKRIESQGTLKGVQHYASRLEGTVDQVFTSLEDAFTGSSDSESPHILVTATFSANSPTRK